MQKRELETISARELREILFHITDDSMTVKELRAKLYEVLSARELREILFHITDDSMTVK